MVKEISTYIKKRTRLRSHFISLYKKSLEFSHKFQAREDSDARSDKVNVLPTKDGTDSEIMAGEAQHLEFQVCKLSSHSSCDTYGALDKSSEVILDTQAVPRIINQHPSYQQLNASIMCKVSSQKFNLIRVKSPTQSITKLSSTNLINYVPRFDHMFRIFELVLIFALIISQLKFERFGRCITKNFDLVVRKTGRLASLVENLFGCDHMFICRHRSQSNVCKNFVKWKEKHITTFHIQFIGSPKVPEWSMNFKYLMIVGLYFWFVCGMMNYHIHTSFDS